MITPMKKRSFILLEALIAIALLSGSLIPLSSAPYKRYKEELELLRKFELERLEPVVLKEVLDHLPELVKKRQINLSPRTIHLDPLPDTTYKVQVKLSPDNRDKQEKPSPHHLWTCTITFIPPQPLSRFVIKHTLFTSEE